MKDFKQTTKMKAQGNHYKTGGDVDLDDLSKAMRSGKIKDNMPSVSSEDRGINIPGMGRAKSATMPDVGPSRDSGIDLPGVGKVKPAPMPNVGRLQPLKRGGTVKRNK